MIPEFIESGTLPPGTHWATWTELVDRFGTNSRRNKLLTGLRMALDALKFSGCRTVYIDGSFVTNKELPGDFDGLWDTDGVDVARLKLVEPTLFETANFRAAQKAKFGGEFFPIDRTNGTWDAWLHYFQHDQAGNPKGIIAVDVGNLE